MFRQMASGDLLANTLLVAHTHGIGSGQTHSRHGHGFREMEMEMEMEMELWREFPRWRMDYKKMDMDMGMDMGSHGGSISSIHDA
jgi:hypothetical protein